MRRVICMAIVFSVYAFPAEAAYRVYLKNGAVIKGIGYYEKANGQIRLYYGGGMVGIPEADVKVIQEAGKPAPSIEAPGAAQPEPSGETPEGAEPERGRLTPEGEALVKGKMAEIDARLKEIKTLEDRLGKLRAELNEVSLRVEQLFQKGRSSALARGRPESEWFMFLTPQESQWSQFNTIRKKELQDEIKSVEETLQPLLKEKEEILRYRSELEGELR